MYRLNRGITGSWWRWHWRSSSPTSDISCKHKRTPARVLFSVLGTVLGKQKETPGG